LDGRIDLETYDRKAQEIRQQQGQLQQKIDEFQLLAAQPAAESVDLAALFTLAGKIFLNQPAREQRRLLQILIEDASWKSGVLRVNLRAPFAALRR
jgi:hypothetical protein